MSKPSINHGHVLVLGAGPGLSAAVARRFGRGGYAITLVARNEHNLRHRSAQGPAERGEATPPRHERTEPVAPKA